MSSVVIRNGTIVNEGVSRKGDILIVDEKIKAIGYVEPENIPPGSTEIDASGMLVMPGIIDDHVHLREPGLTHKADIFSETRAAVAGGVTSFMDMPNTIPQTITIKDLNEKFSVASDRSLINYSFYLGATGTNVNELLNADPETVCGIKLFLGASTGNMLLNDEKIIKEIFSHARMTVACHCEDEDIIKKNIALFSQKYGNDLSVTFHPMIRSREACMKATSFIIRLASEYNTRLHLLHISTADETALFRGDIPLSQKRITAEACISHLWFDDSGYERLGNLIKCNPAIKTRFDRSELIKGINDGRIDVVATDHAPHSVAEKSQTYLKAPSGIPMIQHSLAVMMELYNKGVVTPEIIVEKMCHNPAIIFRIR